jgi:hypothetical protein
MQLIDLEVRCVDEDGGRPISARQVSLQNLSCKRETVTSQLGRLQNDDSVMNRCVAFVANFVG